jgi:hypothetical protein
MPRRATFRMSDLIVVGHATHEPIITGDFVRLASGSPLGLVSRVDRDAATVTWLTSPSQQTELPWVCLRPVSCGNDTDRAALPLRQ